ncbi:Exostosin family protein [Klebsormidium nitens]|uniref:Exostosin family protein n=1 Tax=Klebsormidium nitens TaxID=105231 RepID=A0A1Y1HHB8_KLENI|nr:Exostosin family protein [Klebsormidium nitens]|eukprot:GAQ77844.1 Exostosin family protein [Klebsormidium nitens]
MGSLSFSSAASRKSNLLICLCLSIAALAAVRSISTLRANSPRALLRVSGAGNREVLTASSYHARSRSPLSKDGSVEMSDSQPLRVFVYDVPRRFTFGMIETYYQARGLKDSEPDKGGGPDTVPAYPAHQHASEWWLFQSLFTQEELRTVASGGTSMRRKVLEAHSNSSSGAKPRPARRKSLVAGTANPRKRSAYAGQHVSSSTAIRVTSPEDADVILVPFFSSLSLIVLPLDKVRAQGAGADVAGGADVARYDDEAEQRALMGWVEAQEPWKRSGGRDHVFVSSDPAAMSEVHDRTKNSILLVADFGRLRPDQASLQKDVVIPYVHRVPIYTPQDEGATPAERHLLLFFAGNRFRKEGGTIRTKLFEVLATEESVSMVEGIPSAEGRRAAMKGMRTSKFCLSPAGDTPSACRLFDAIVNLCVPVVVSDRIELPFEDRLDYSTFALFIPEAKALEPGYLAGRLRAEIAAGRWEGMQRRLREVRSLFEYSEPYGAIDMVWDKIATKVPAVREAIHRERRSKLGELPA